MTEGHGTAPERDGAVDGPAPGEPEAGAEGVRTRRDLLAVAGRALVALCGVGGAGVAARLVFDAPSQVAARAAMLGQRADFRFGTVTWLPERELFVLHDEAGLRALSSRCSHLGCTVARVAEGFACPCHGARFDHAGKPTAGPARRSLREIGLRIDAQGRLVVDEAEAG